jgi:hypothetical protein
VSKLDIVLVYIKAYVHAYVSYLFSSYIFPGSLSQLRSTTLRLKFPTVEWLLRLEFERDGARNHSTACLTVRTFRPVAATDAAVAVAVEIRNNGRATKEESSEGSACVADLRMYISITFHYL